MWEDNHELLAQRFPHGLQWLRDTLGVPFACHMGKWYHLFISIYFIIYLSFFSIFSCRVSDSPYTKNESYGFVTEKQWAVPTSIEFWDYIFANASGWGLNTIKQDHIVCSSSSLY